MKKLFPVKPLLVAVIVASILLFVRWRVSFPMLLADRWIDGLGYLQVAVAAIGGAWLFTKMEDEKNVAKYRRGSWIAFCLFFFVQLVLGMTLSEQFLLKGEAHFPFPTVILGGALYRMEVGFMLILFLSTLLLSSGAWCSHLCYMGGFDLLCSGKKEVKALNYSRRDQWIIKTGVLFSTIFVALLFRWLGVDALWVNAITLLWGVAGVVVMLTLSRQKKKMIHCTYFCPIGTVVSLLKKVNPVRIRINEHCTQCLKCTTRCKYNALDKRCIERKRPALTCTSCGDCLSACTHKAIEYRIGCLSDKRSRDIYLIVSVALYASFFMLGRV